MEPNIYLIEPQTILKADQTALVIGEDGNLRLVVPVQDPEQHAELMTALLAAVYVRARDPAWVEEMFVWFTTT